MWRCQLDFYEFVLKMQVFAAHSGIFPFKHFFICLHFRQFNATMNFHFSLRFVCKCYFQFNHFFRFDLYISQINGSRSKQSFIFSVNYSQYKTLC